MSRKLPEWIGKTDDTPIPTRVKVRIFDKFDGICQGCGNRIIGKLVPNYDHILSIINGGENRENNLQLLCTICHAIKTKIDIKEKALVYRKKAKNLGLKLKRGRSFPGSRNSPWKKMMTGRVVRRDR